MLGILSYERFAAKRRLMLGCKVIKLVQLLIPAAFLFTDLGRNTRVITPRPFVRPSRNSIVVPSFTNSGLYMKRNRIVPLSCERRYSLSISTTFAACRITPQWITAW